MGTLTDAGPLVALIDRAQEKHVACTKAIRSISMPLVTTWPCLTEALYFLGRDFGWRGQEQLWIMLTSGRLRIHLLNDAEVSRIQTLMERYRDVPMDLADASLVSAAETLRTRRVFTIDGDFRIYRAHGREAFEVVP